MAELPEDEQPLPDRDHVTGEKRAARSPRRREYQYDDEDAEENPFRKPRELGDDPAMRMLLPVGLSLWAIAAGYLGLISVLCVPAPLAVLCGVMAIREMERNPRKHGMGRAVFGIIMGALGSVGLAFALLGTILGR